VGGVAVTPAERYEAQEAARKSARDAVANRLQVFSEFLSTLGNERRIELSEAYGADREKLDTDTSIARAIAKLTCAERAGYDSCLLTAVRMAYPDRAAEREQAWLDVARATRVLRAETDPLVDAVMRRDPHALKAVADALAQAVTALVANAEVLSEEAP